MNPRRDTFVAILLPLLIGVAIVGVFLVSYRFTTQNHGEERFLVYWAGMRAWLVDGNSPYSDATASHIQELAVHSGDSQCSRDLSAIRWVPFPAVRGDPQLCFGACFVYDHARGCAAGHSFVVPAPDRMAYFGVADGACSCSWVLPVTPA